MTPPRKKLIEVALPLEAINAASAREKSIRHGHPSTLHLWWARRPLAAARAVIFSQMVDDPSANPDLFPTEAKQDKERQRLFNIIKDLVKWENTTNEEVLERARNEIWQSWRRACAQNADHPRAKEIFNRHQLPAFHDPFAGGGALPLEAQRLGLEAHASDLNPVAVMINKAMIEIPPKFANLPPVNPEWQQKSPEEKTLTPWKGAQGLAEDVRYYGQWMRDEAEKRIGHLYPKVKITADMVKDRPDLKNYVGEELTVIAWLWARTVESSNPAFRGCQVPLITTFWLSTKKGKEAYIEPMVEGKTYRFEVRLGKPDDTSIVKSGTKLGRGANFRCLLSDFPLAPDYIKAEGVAGRMGARLMAIVCAGKRERVYLPPLAEHEEIARQAMPAWKPDGDLPDDPRNFWTVSYGLTKYADLFTERQLVALTTLSDLVAEAREQIIKDGAGVSRLAKDEKPAGKRQQSHTLAEYADAASTYLAFGVSKTSNRSSSLCSFKTGVQCPGDTFGRQTLPMVWDYTESNAVSGPSGSFESMINNTVAGLQSNDAIMGSTGHAWQDDASKQTLSMDKLISTDPPYYDNIGYADLSDFFYVWLRRSLRAIYPDLFSTLVVPKAEELVATPYRHGSKDAAEAFFLAGMTQAMQRLAEQAHPAFPVTIYYAFKQSERETDGGTASTGWETFLEAIIRAGFGITGTWPVRTERENRKINQGTNALASSIVLVCRPRPANAKLITRKDFLAALREDLPPALRLLQEGNIAPVDLAQASIGPGMAVFSRYSQILEVDGQPMTVRTALQLINQTLDEVLAEQEGDFDPETVWAIAWFEQFGFEEAPFGVAETLCKAKNTAPNALVEAGIVASGRGQMRLLRVDELPTNWDPAADKRLTIWECVHHLIRVMEAGGEVAAADLVARLGHHADIARELAYRLYTISERRKRAADALAYNALVQSWPEIQRLSTEVTKKPEIGVQGELL